MIRKFLFLLLAVCLPMASAIAADLPVKAPVSPVTVLPSSGFYLGLNAIGAQLNNKFDSPELELPGTGNLKPSGGMAGLTIGWYSQGAALIGIEGDFDYDFTKHDINCVLIANCKIKSGFFMTQRVVLGAPLSTISGVAPTLAKGSNGFVVPTSAWAGQLVPYLTAGVGERRLKACISILDESDCGSKWLVGAVLGGGLKLPVSTHVTFDVSYLYVNWNKSFSPTPSIPEFATFKATDEQILKAGLYLHF